MNDERATLKAAQAAGGRFPSVPAERVVLTYKELRARAYEAEGLTAGAYLDAERKARAGDRSELDALDAKATAIKARFPK